VTSPDASGGSAHYVAFVASSDDGKAGIAVAKDAKPDGDYNGYALYADKKGDGEAAVGDGAVLVSDDAQTLHDAIDARDGKADSLASDDGFNSAMAKLPADSPGPRLREHPEAGRAGRPGRARRCRRQRRRGPDSSALAKTPRLRIDSLVRSMGERQRLPADAALDAEAGCDQSPLAMAPSSLTGLVPGDAFAFLAFGDYGSYRSRASRAARPASARS
jgi:hypothetical protein